MYRYVHIYAYICVYIYTYNPKLEDIQIRNLNVKNEEQKGDCTQGKPTQMVFLLPGHLLALIMLLYGTGWSLRTP